MQGQRKDDLLRLGMTSLPPWLWLTSSCLSRKRQPTFALIVVAAAAAAAAFDVDVVVVVVDVVVVICIQVQ